MIRWAEYQNFYGHRKTRLDFHCGINVIIGTSDRGKTALARGLKWVNFNTPRGRRVRSRWGGDTEVRLGVDDYIVGRGITKSDNYYFIQHIDDKEPEWMRGFGTKVPERVQEIINMDEINYQWQLTAHFMLTLNPPEVARELNKIADLEDIDRSLAFLNKEIYKANQAVNIQDKLLEANEEELTKYNDLDAKDQAVTAVIAKIDKAKKISRQAMGLCKSIEELEASIKEKDELVNVDGLSHLIDSILALIKDYQLIVLCEKKLKLTIRILETNVILDISDTQIIDDTLDKIKRYYKAENECTVLDSYFIVLAQKKKWLDHYMGKLEKCRAELPTACPTCGQELPHEES